MSSRVVWLAMNRVDRKMSGFKTMTASYSYSGGKTTKAKREFTESTVRIR